MSTTRERLMARIASAAPGEDISRFAELLAALPDPAAPTAPAASTATQARRQDGGRPRCATCFRAITEDQSRGGNRAMIVRAGEVVLVHADCVLPSDQYA